MTRCSENNAIQWYTVYTTSYEIMNQKIEVICFNSSNM